MSIVYKLQPSQATRGPSSNRADSSYIMVKASRSQVAQLILSYYAASYLVRFDFH